MRMFSVETQAGTTVSSSKSNFSKVRGFVGEND
jgi:hypothetical protein